MYVCYSFTPEPTEILNFLTDLAEIWIRDRLYPTLKHRLFIQESSIVFTELVETLNYYVLKQNVTNTFVWRRF